jgi:uncharacterized protein YjbI with pentapeptide repeats
MKMNRNLKALVEAAEGKNMRGQELDHVDFTGASLKYADFERAVFWNAKFYKADFTNTDFRDADFQSADLSRAKNLDKSILPYGYRLVEE